jgi:hypothetical protein
LMQKTNYSSMLQTILLLHARTPSVSIVMKNLIRHKRQNEKVTYTYVEKIYSGIGCPHWIQ